MAPMKTKTTLALTALALLFASSPALADGDASHVEDRVHVAPVVVGASLLGTAYMFSVIPAIGADVGNNHSFDAMYAPIVGPFVMAGQAFGPGGGQFGYFGIVVGSLFVADGLVQIAGATLLVYGLATPRKVTVHDAPHFSVVPVIGKNMTGIGGSLVF